jgi:pimeloyl-ACP methyl ester carboxylesterase
MQLGTLPVMKRGTEYIFAPQTLTGEFCMIRCTALCMMMLVFIAPKIEAQNPTPQSGSSPTSAALPGFDESAYRDLNPTLQFFRARSAKEYAIDTARGIDEASFVPIGGIQQWVTIRGEDRNNPVLLFLHGGPGEATNLWSLPYFFPWDQRFTVVQWDQRGAGKTFGKSGPSVARTMTLDRMTQDGIELTEYLCKHLGKHKIILVAHSFGTLLGLRMIQQRPDLFIAYVGTGQVADETQNYSVAYKALLSKAETTGNEQALNDLKRVGPPPYNSYDGYSVQRRWSNRFEGAERFLPGTIGIALEAPGYTVRDLDDLLAGELFSGNILFTKTRSQTMKDLGLKFSIPVFFFEGTEDFTTPTELACQYLDALQAPEKEFVPIPGGHFAVFINSDEFLRRLVAHISPLIANSQ